MAIIITTHMPRNDAAATGHVCPGIHVMDIVQPPGIGIPPIADMDVHQTTVTAVLAAKSSVETPRNTCCEARAEAMRSEISCSPRGLGAAASRVIALLSSLSSLLRAFGRRLLQGR
jgi:hypothetical protein